MTAVVFDFDQTLTKNHLFYELYTTKRSPEFARLKPSVLLSNYDFIVNHIFGGADRIKNLTRTFKSLGVTLMISSHGFIKDIVASLKFLQDNGFELSPEMFEFIHGKVRSTGLSYQKSPFGIFIPKTNANVPFDGDKFVFLNNFVRGQYDKCIVFLDDDGEKYFKRLKETQYENYHIIPVPKQGGLDEKALTILKEQTAKCIQCKITGARWKERTNPNNVFCSSVCQMKYYF